MTPEMHKLFFSLTQMICETVKEAEKDGLGFPNGYLYLAFIEKTKVTLEQYNSLISLYVRLNILKKQGDLLYLGKVGQEFLDKISSEAT